MASSLTQPRRVESAEHLEVPCLMDLLDPRDPRGRRPDLPALLTAMATGANSPTAIAGCCCHGALAETGTILNSLNVADLGCSVVLNGVLSICP